MSGQRTRLHDRSDGRRSARAGAARAPLCWPRSAAATPDDPTPTPRSPRPGTRAAAPPVRSGPRTAASTRSVSGFGQNFAGGKIFFTPDTGAHVMRGAILDKYQSLGGPADGDLGFPPSTRARARPPDSRNTTFSAADKPVIFWTPDTGAHVVRGAINAAWDKLGGSAGPARRARPRTRRTSGDRRHPELHRRRGDLEQEGQGVHHGSAGAGRTACGPARSRTTPPRPSTRPAARPGGRSARSGAAQGPPYAIGPDGARAELRRRQDLLQPGHRRQRRHRARCWPSTRASAARRATSACRPASEADGGLATESRISTLRRRGQAGDLLDARLRRRHRARGDERRVGQARRRDRVARRADGRPDRERRRHHAEDSAAARSPGTSRPTTFSTEPANLASQLAGLAGAGTATRPKAPALPQAVGSDGKQVVSVAVVVVAARRSFPLLVLVAARGGCGAAEPRRGADDRDSRTTTTSSTYDTAVTTTRPMPEATAADRPASDARQACTLAESLRQAVGVTRDTDWAGWSRSASRTPATIAGR